MCSAVTLDCQARLATAKAWLNVSSVQSGLDGERWPRVKALFEAGGTAAAERDAFLAGDRDEGVRRESRRC